MESRDYEKILNAIPETGVYVIRAEDRGILYFNHRVKEVSPGARLGVSCRELWAGSCSCCPLLNIEDSPENRSVGYNESYGGVVDITATKTLWEGEIPAYVLTVSPRTDSGGYTYRKILRVDLRQDSCEVIKSDPEGWQPVMGKIPLSGQLAAFARSGEIHPQDAERFVEFTKIENLRRLPPEGQEALTLIYRRRSGGEYRWNLMELIPEQSTGEHAAMLCVKDVHEILREGLERDNALREAEQTARESQMAAILRTRFKMMNTVHLDTGLCERVSLDHGEEQGPVLVGDYAEYVQRALECYVYPDDAENFRSVLSLGHLQEKAEQTRDYAEETCVYRQRGETLRWIELRVIYARQGDDVLVNILGQDITSEKNREETRLRALEDRAYIIGSLSSLFFSTYYIDLEHDTFRTVTQQSRVGDVLGDEVNFTAALQIYTNHFIHPDDREGFLRVMNVDNMMQKLRWWQPCVAVEYRKLLDEPGVGGEDAWGWVRATAVLSRAGLDDMPKTVVYVAQDIDESSRTHTSAGS